MPLFIRSFLAILWFKLPLPCKQTLFYFSFVLFNNIGELASEVARENDDPLAVNKSPAVYILSPALDGL